MFDESYFRTLSKYFQGYNLDNPFILNLGCGECYEGSALTKYFNNPIVVGVDTNSQDLDFARKRNSSDSFEFIDLSISEISHRIKEKVDIIIFRNPNFVETVSWKKALKQCSLVSHYNTILFSTANFSLTHQDALNAISKSKYDIKIAEEDSESNFTPNRAGMYMSLDDGFVLKAQRSQTKFEAILEKAGIGF